tara:strand:+ start:2568 stop:2786 length:219 start_codon:yes stop_codon:yes gene_type:complete
MITPDEQQADLTTLAYDATSEDLGGAKHFRNLSGVDSLDNELGDEPPFLQENTQVADDALSDPNQNPSSYTA